MNTSRYRPPSSPPLGHAAPAPLAAPEWMRLALCAQIDPDLWYPQRGASPRTAKQVCAACPVRAACLDYALTNDERYGIYGGLSVRERLTLRGAA